MPAVPLALCERPDPRSSLPRFATPARESDTDPPVLAHEALGDPQARPILFLHGLFARGRDLVPLAESVIAGAPQARGLLPDLLGHGASPPLPGNAVLATAADALVAWLDALGVTERIAVVAHSMGGRVALRARDLAPERFGPLAFIDTPAGDLQPRRSPLAPYIKSLLSAPAEADSQAELLVPFEKIMVSAGLLRWTAAQTAQAPDGKWRWTFEREAMTAYRWNTMGEDLWPVVAQLGEGELTVVAPQRSAYVRAEDRERYAALGFPVALEPKGTHDMYKALAPDKLALIRTAVGQPARC